MRLKDGYSSNSTSEAGISSAIAVGQGENLTVQVQGTATSFSLAVEGSAGYSNSDYVELCGINSSSFETSNLITENGIYFFGVDGLLGVRFNLKAVEGGNVIIYYCITRGE